MTLTINDLRSAVRSFQEVNRKEGRRQELYAAQRSAVFQMLRDDMIATETKAPVSRNRRDRQHVGRPSFVAPLEFGRTETRKVEILWPCTMHKLESTVITSVGYNEQHRVLKLVFTNGYVYAYQDVPESCFQAFLNVPSPGKYFNRFRKNYAGVALV